MGRRRGFALVSWLLRNVTDHRVDQGTLSHLPKGRFSYPRRAFSLSGWTVGAAASGRSGGSMPWWRYQAASSAMVWARERKVTPSSRSALPAHATDSMTDVGIAASANPDPRTARVIPAAEGLRDKSDRVRP